MPVAIALPSVFGRYQIECKLGEGGMGAVYLAEDTSLGRKVALKVPFFSAEDEAEVIPRFQREARVAAALDHPNICMVLEIGERDGIHYLTMPFIEGEPLSKLAGRGKAWAPHAAVELVRTLALALDAVHKKGVMHRDLKPANIMMKHGATPIIMDFGLARSYGGGDRLTVSGAMQGTPAYMSPEQVLCENVSFATDIYTLGVIFYELLTGQLPFTKPVPAIFREIELAAPTSPSHLKIGVVEEVLAALCLKAMAKQAVDRYPSMAALATALEGYLANPVASAPGVLPRTRKGPDRPQGFPATTPAGSAIDTAKAHGSSPTTPVRQRRPRGTKGPLVAAGVGVLVLGLIMWIFFLAVSGKDDTSSKTSSLASATGPAEPPAPLVKPELDKVPPREEAKPEPPTAREEPPKAKDSPRKEPVNGKEPEPTPAKPADKPNPPAPKPKEAPPIALAPFDATFARQHQQRWAAYLATEVEITNSIGMKLVLIPPGEFLMGSDKADDPEAYDDELPRRRVRLTQAFYLGLHEVTQTQYEQVMGSNPSHFKGGDLPVEMVSWEDAVAFCTKLSGRDGRAYRLPTEAEWEFTCRAGTATKYGFGDDKGRLGEHAWFTENSGSKTHPVGQKRPNGFGLFDMHGNVGEWCADWDGNYGSQNTLLSDPNGSSDGDLRVLRGGSWYNIPWDARSAFRSRSTPGDRGGSLGFRVVLALPPRTP